MPDNCNPNNCPVGVRLDGLEKEFDRYRTDANGMHKAMDKRIGDLEKDSAASSTKLDSIEDKLDTLISWREEQDNKPNRLIDHLKENAINYIMLAMLGLMMLKMGIGA